MYRVHAPVTTHEKRHPTPDRASSFFIIIARRSPSSPNRASAVRDARFRSIRSTPRTRSSARYPSHRLLFDVARPRRRARARRGRKPRASTDATDRRRRPTTTRATRMSRYGRKGVDTVRARVSTRSIDQSARAATPPRVARARPPRSSTKTATEATHQTPRRVGATPGCLKKTHLGGRARTATRRIVFARRYPCDA